MTIEELFAIIKDRKQQLPKSSYIASLFKDGTSRIAQKVGEEATEVVIAASHNEGKKRITQEVADLWFHLLILLAHFDIAPSDVLSELEKRHKNYQKEK